MKALLPAVFFLTLSSLTACGQAWKENYANAKSSYYQGNYRQAQALAESSLKEYPENVDEKVINRASILQLLSRICYAQEKYAAGLEYNKKEVESRENRKDTAYAAALIIQARFYEQLGKNELALVALLRCHDALSKFYKAKEKPLLECNLHIAIQYYLNQEFDKAVEWFKPALHTAEGKKVISEEILRGFYFYSLLELETNKVKEAEQSFNKVLQWSKSPHVKGEAESALALNGLATAQSLRHSYSEADETFRLALSAYENSIGDKGSFYPKIIAGRAVNFQQMGKFFQAEEILKRIPNRHEKESKRPPELDSAILFQTNKNFEKAEGLYQKALSQYIGEDKESLAVYADINQNMAMMYLDKGDFASALTQFAETRELVEKLHGYYHRKYVHVLNAMGFLYIQLRSWTEAEASFRQSFQIMNRMLAKPDVELLSALSGMEKVERGKGNLLKADSINNVVLKTTLSPLKELKLLPKHPLKISWGTEASN